MRTSRSVLSLALLFASAASALAKVEIGELNLESLLDPEVVSASRRSEKASDAPAAVFVLTGEDIRRQGFRSIADAVATIPGLFVSDQRTFQYVGVRGLNLLDDYSAHVLVLIDGHPMNNSGLTNTFLSRELPVTLAALDRIEVIFGPVGGVYGPFAFFAVLNLVTSAGKGESSAFVSADVDGRPSAFEAGVTVDRKVGPVEVFFHAGIFRDAGHDFAFPALETPDRPVPPGGRVPGADASEAQNVYGRLRYRELTLTLGYASRRQGDPFASYFTIAGDTRNEWGNRIGFGQLAWEGQLSEGVKVLARLSYDVARATDRFVYPEPPLDIGSTHDFARDTFWSAELRTELRPWSRTRVALGLEGQLHDTLQLFTADSLPDRNVDPVGGVGVGPIAVSYRSLNAHVLLEQGVGESLSLHAGLNLYSHSLFGERLTGKLAAVYRLGTADTFKLVWSQGFRPPTVGEAFYDDALYYAPNPALRPERADSIEAIWERRFGSVASLRLNAFRSVYRDLIGYHSVPTPGLDHPADPNTPSDYRLQPANLDSANVLGAEAAVRLQLRSVLQAYGGVSIARSTLDADAAESANFAQATATAALSTRWPWEPLTISANAQLVSARKLSALPGEELPPSVSPYLRLNASARLEVPGARGLFVQLSALNLLSAAIAEPLPSDQAPLRSFTLPGASFRALLEYRR